MTQIHQVTKAQEQRSYRNAVRMTLEEFYGKATHEAIRLEREWWKRLENSGAADSGLFLHAEPMNTAAGIASASVIPLTAKNREGYYQILERSHGLAVHKPLANTLQMKQSKRHWNQAINVVGGQRPGTAYKAAAKKAAPKKAATKQHMTFG